MNSETVYSLLMGLGWFFLLGWAIALLAACASVFWPKPLDTLRANFAKPTERKL
jgi:hypothetical protein